MVLNKFIRGRQSPEGYPCSSRPSDAMNQLSATAMQSCMVLENLRVGLMASAVAHKKSHISTVSVKQTIPQSFRVLNVSALWVCQNLSAYDRCQWVASSQELLTSDEKLFCRRVASSQITCTEILGDPKSRHIQHMKTVEMCNSFATANAIIFSFPKQTFHSSS